MTAAPPTKALGARKALISLVPSVQPLGHVTRLDPHIIRSSISAEEVFAAPWMEGAGEERVRAVCVCVCVLVCCMFVLCFNCLMCRYMYLRCKLTITSL